MVTHEGFREIETRWRHTFIAPYVGRVKLEDADDRVDLAVYDGDGNKVWELRENLDRLLTVPGALESIAEDARKSLSP
jgi:hypothetical protein